MTRMIADQVQNYNELYLLSKTFRYYIQDSGTRILWGIAPKSLGLCFDVVHSMMELVRFYSPTKWQRQKLTMFHWKD